jgi:hypothetical protein
MVCGDRDNPEDKYSPIPKYLSHLIFLLILIIHLIKKLNIYASAVVPVIYTCTTLY